MAVFTQTLADVIKNKPADVSRDEWIGLDEYTVTGHDKADLNQRIVDHFWMREIGFETNRYFAFKMKVKMNEIMPKYNLLFETDKSHWDKVFQTVSLHTTNTGEANQVSDGTDNGTSKAHTVENGTDDGTTHSKAVSESTSDSKTKSRSVNSQTPQTQLSGNGNYASAMADVNSEQTQDNTGNQTNDGTTHKVSSDTADRTGSTTDTRHNTLESTNTRDTDTLGYNGIPADLINAYRESIINVVMLIINELNELFMTVWENGDDQSLNFNRREWNF
jgi:hypothetical protein